MMSLSPSKELEKIAKENGLEVIKKTQFNHWIEIDITPIYILVVYLTNSSKIRKIYYQEKMILQRALTFWVCWCCCCTVKNIDMATLEYAFAKSHNPNHLGNILLETIDKCYCEPYNKNQSNSRPSIVRFPVSFSQYYIYS